MKIIKYLFNAKYRLFCRKIRDVQVSIWELDFKISKARYLREGIRQERDRAIENRNGAQQALDKATTEDDKKKYTDQVAYVSELIGKYEKQMSLIDDEIEGRPDTAEIQGQTGYKEIVRGLAELREMYKDYLATQI